MRWRLAHPRAPRVLVSHGGANRIEISLSREVLVLYRNNQVQLISHVSTGGHYPYCSPNRGFGVPVAPARDHRTGVVLRGWGPLPPGEAFHPVVFIGAAVPLPRGPDRPP